MLEVITGATSGGRQKTNYLIVTERRASGRAVFVRRKDSACSVSPGVAKYWVAAAS